MGQIRTLVLARGRGRRMQAAQPGVRLTAAQESAARAGWKALMPVAGRPFLDFVLSSLADAGCYDAALVIGPEQRDAFAAYRNSGGTRRVRLEFVEQGEARGTADAVWSARDWVGHEPFLVMNSDNLYPVEVLRDLAALDGPGLAVFDRDELIESSNIPSERVAAFALVTVTSSGELATIVEKPSKAEMEQPGGRPLVSMNVWRFDWRLVEACRDVPLSSRGEHEIPEAARLALSRGVRIAAVPAHGPVLDLSSQTDVADVSRRLAGVTPRP